MWQLFAPNPEAMAEAEDIIEDILMEEKVPELEFGGTGGFINKAVKKTIENDVV